MKMIFISNNNNCIQNFLFTHFGKQGKAISHRLI